jgi:hypothetical protein
VCMSMDDIGRFDRSIWGGIRVGVRERRVPVYQIFSNGLGPGILIRHTFGQGLGKSRILSPRVWLPGRRILDVVFHDWLEDAFSLV